MSGGGHRLKMKRHVFVCYEYSFVAVGEHYHDGLFVGVEALCPRSDAESS